MLPRRRRRRTIGDILQCLTVESPEFVKAVRVLAERELRRVKRKARTRRC